MQDNSKLSEIYSKITDFLSEQEWFQQIKGKWEELDPQSRNNLRIVLSGLAAFGFVFMVFSLFWGLHSQRKELADKQDVLHFIQDSNEKIRALNESGIQPSSADTKLEAWSSYLETTAGIAGIDKPSLTISPEKSANTDRTAAQSAKDPAKEALIQVDVKHVSIKQIVKFAFSLESGSRPIKLRNLQIDTKNDPAGYMDATLQLSGFTVTSAKEGK